MSKARIDSFFKEPSIESEINEEIGSNTVVSISAQENNLIRFMKDSPYRQKTSISSQRWSGHVTNRTEEYFKAIISDHSNGNPDEEIEMPLKAVSQDDLHLVVEGALFDWHIGYERISGTTQRYSKVLFRRMSRWTSDDFNRAKKLKNKMKNFLLKHSE